MGRPLAIAAMGAAAVSDLGTLPAAHCCGAWSLVFADGYRTLRPSSHPGDVQQLHGVGGEGKAGKELEPQ